jgi:cardiolipin synthase (CMP-forming)
MFTIPNILTFARLLLVPCFLVASMRGMYATAFVIFVSAAVTDILDGAIARRMNLRSRLGALLDPAADKTLMVCGFLYYTFAGNLPRLALPGWLTFTVFIRDFLIAVFAYLMYTRVHVTRFPPSIAGKTSTVLQAVTLATAIAVNAFLPQVRPFAELLFRLSLLMTLFSGWGYLRRASLLLRGEASPARA